MINVLKNLHVLLLDVLILAITLIALTIVGVLFALTCTLTLSLCYRSLDKIWQNVNNLIIYTGLDIEESLGKLIIE